MTLAERHALIDRVVSKMERHFPLLMPPSLLEASSALLASEYGLTVTTEEIVRVLSQLAEPRP